MPVANKPTQSANAPAGTPLLSDGFVDIKLDGSGNGTVTTAPVKVERSGWYSYDTDFTGTVDNAAVDAGYGVPAETGFVDKYTPAIVTTSSADGNKLRVGDVVTDTIKVTGGRPGANMNILTRLYGPVASEPKQSPNAPAGTPLVQEATMTVKLDNTGNATVTTAPFTSKVAGWYTYDTDFAGDDNHKAFDAGYGVPSETGFVNTWTPEATTKTSDQLITGPDELADTVVVSGGKPSAEFTGSATLYGPFDTDPSAGGGIDLTGKPSVGTVEFAGTYDADGNAQVITPPVKVTEPGFYVWAETIDAVAGVSEQWKQTRAMASETSVNIQPTIYTAVNDQMVLPGHTISDRVEVSGIENTVGGKPVTHVVTGSLYGPVAQSMAHASWSIGLMLRWLWNSTRLLLTLARMAGLN